MSESAITLHITRTTATSPISTSHDIQVPTVAAAIAHASLYENDADAITFAVFAGPRFLGSGIAGNGGRFVHEIAAA